MALKSVVQIEVQDAEFQRFSAMFDKYKEGLAATPDAWKAADVAAAATTGRIAAGAEGLEHHVVLINQAAGASKAAAAHTVSQAGAWHSMARNARTFAGHVFEATRSLLRWGELTGVISGILGGGGLLGIDRLAMNAGERRKSALGLGVKPGEETSFDVNLSRIMDPRAFLEHINRGKTFISSDERRGIGALGIDPGAKDTAGTAIDTLRSLKKLVDSIPESGMGVFGEIMHARGADALMPVEQLQTLRSTKAPEFEKYLSDTVADFKRFNLPDASAKVWQDLQVQLKRAGETIETEFQKALTPLAPSIEALSGTFTKLVTDLMNNPNIKEWLDDLNTGLKELDAYIGTEQFKKDMNDFVKGVGELAKSVWNTIKQIESWFKSSDGKDSDFETGVKETAKFLGILWHAVDDAGKSIASFAHSVIDPIIDLFGKKTPDGPDDPMTRSPFSTEGTHKQIPFWPHWKGGEFSDPSGEFGPPTASPMDYNVPRGIRTKNPLLINYVPGQEGAVGSDGRFGIYGSMEQGVASAERQLLRYQDRGLDTLEKIINKWAPPSENDTPAYIADVSRRSGIDLHEQIDFRNRQQAVAVIASMARHETGQQLDPAVINRGVGMGMGGAAANGVKRTTVDINVNNATGANITSSVAQLAV